MTIEMIVMSRITVAGANLSTVVPMVNVVNGRKDALASATKTKDMQAKVDGAVNGAAVHPPAEVASPKVAAKIMTGVGRVTGITPVIVIAATEPMGKIITRAAAVA